MKNANKYYKENILDLEKIDLSSSKVQRLLKLYFNRQQTYEFSGYAILLLCIVFLGGCILIFIFSNKITVAAGTKPETNDYWIALLSLRVGISLIVFFVCQVLLRLYRYCVKFAVFYIGMFDALLMYDELKKDLKEAVDLFTPNIDIGDTPASPSTDLIKILENLNKAKTPS
ncbi:MAG TPA: hypothetical protein VF974_04205 [Patescibacteria group bacterium]